MTNSKRYKYNSKRDYCCLKIGVTIFAINFILFALVAVWTEQYYQYQPETLDFTILIAIVALVMCISSAIYAFCISLAMWAGKFEVLTINNEEILYEYGRFTKKSKSIPIKRIRSCSTKASPLQKHYGLMDISITTAGDQAEIYFENIENGEEAYQIIRQLARQFTVENEK